MERSEMVVEITKILKKYRERGSRGLRFGDDVGEILESFVAKEILDMQEKAGMLPPWIDPCPEDPDSFFPPELHEYHWEPEENPPCESCARNDQPNCGNEHCPTNRKDE